MSAPTPAAAPGSADDLTATPPAGASRPVELVEVGPRDGLQNERAVLPVSTRVELITRLIAAGARRLEVASFVRPDAVPQMAGAEEVLAALAPREDVTYVGLVLNERGARRAVETACDEVNVVVPVTDEFARRNQGVGVDGLVEQTAAATSVAREAGLSVSVTLAVAFGCPFTGPVPVRRVARVLEQVVALVPDEVALADTVGVAVPPQVEELGAVLRDLGVGPALRPRFHFHNTRNTGYANAWAATRLDLGPAAAGLPVALDASIGGFGGCPFAPAATGNIATEDLLYLLLRSGVPLHDPAPERPALSEVAAWLQAQLDSPVAALLGRAGGFGPVA